MKKRNELQLIMISIFLLVVLPGSVSAIVGVSPGRYETDFEPNLKKDFTFNFLFDSGVESEVYAAGDLAQYVRLSTDYLKGGGGVTASVSLPSDIQIPGNHGISIGARQKSSQGSGVGIVGNVIGNIIIKVPYPGKYAEAEFQAANANPGEPIDLKVIVHNLGKEDIAASVAIDIIGSSDNTIEKLSMGNSFIESTMSKEFFAQLNTSNYKSGDYKAIATVNYGGGKDIRVEKTFRLGRLFVGIFNYTQEFERKKINRLEIEAESFWNDPIQNLYANVSIINYSMSFLTPSTTIEPWSRIFLTGFFDTSQIEAKDFSANISLYYGEHVSSREVSLRFKKEKVNYTAYAIIGASIGILIMLIAVIVILFRKSLKNAKTKKKK